MSQHTCSVGRSGALGMRQGRATHFAALWLCQWGRGQRGNNATCLACALLSRYLHFLLPPQPPQVFTARRSEALFCLCWSLGLRDLSRSPVVPPSLSTHKRGAVQSTSRCHAECPLHPSCPSPPLLPVWMDVSSLTPWLSDFHTV